MRFIRTKLPLGYKRLLRTLLVITAVLLVGSLGLHIWFVKNARGVLKQMVAEKSGGKIKLELSAVSFSLFSNKIQIREADLLSTDSLTQPTTYRVKFRKLTLRVASFWPLLLQKKLLLDSIKLHDPEVTVTQWKKDTLTGKSKDELSISQEMGKLYNSMLDALEDFGIRRIVIDNAWLSLVNKMKPGVEPITISKVYFSLIRTAAKKGRRDAFVANEQTVDLNTTDQNIALPGGRHRLAFKNFRLELFRKRIELDSCTVSAKATAASPSHYTIFFKKLLLVGVDFDAMYRYNLIRADSVYCENPLFNIDINTLASGSTSKKKERPDPEKIVRELTGDLDLAFVGVKDAGIHINIAGAKDRSLFNSNKDNFEMRGLRINGDSAKPVVVQRFDMLVRDYHLYNNDSSAAYTFDSIHFVNNKIILNNFSMQTAANKKRRLAKKDFTIPFFELTGLDWYELTFNQNLVAKEALLYNPVISFATSGAPPKRKKTSLFASLHSMDDLLTLDKLTVVNGELNMQLGTTTGLNLHHVNLNLNSNQLLRSNNKEGLRKAVEQLSFTDGFVRLKEITAQLKNARYTGSNLIRADELSVNSRDGKLKAVVKKTTIDNLLFDDSAERVELDGLHWDAATVFIQGGGQKLSQKKGGGLLLKNISGHNTRFQFSNAHTTVNTFLSTVKLASFSNNNTAVPELTGLLLAGNPLEIATNNMHIHADDYLISDQGSYLHNLKLEQEKNRDTIHLTAPRIDFATDLDALMKNKLHLLRVAIQKPSLFIHQWADKASNTATLKTLVLIDDIHLAEPNIHIAIHHHDSLSSIHLPAVAGSRISASGIAFSQEGLGVTHLAIHTNAATFIKPDGEVLGVEKGKVDIEASDIHLSKKEGKPVWSALINNLQLQNPNHLVLGKKRSRLMTEQLSLGNVRLSSESLTDVNKLIRLNVSAWLHTATGQFVDSTTTLQWYNAAYDAGHKTLSLDSFVYHPTASKDSVMAHTPYQTDYITLHTGAVKLIDFNLDQYQKDTALIARTITIAQPLITIYRDKAPPLPTGITRQLPVGMIKKIRLPIAVEQVRFQGGMLSYTEKNAKTGAEGTLVLTRLNGGLSNIKNRELRGTDSLQFSLNAWLMDSAEMNLRVRESYTDTLNGFLMTLRMKPTALSFLNPVLAPLSNVIIKSGIIDSLRIRAIGKEDLALGEMQMYYHNLRIQLVKEGDANKSTFFGNIASALANTFVIKKNNNGRTGLIYFKRDKSRSFFNYLIRMTFSGMATSVGVKKNSRYIKQYQKELRQKNLPPIELE